MGQRNSVGRLSQRDVRRFLAMKRLERRIGEADAHTEGRRTWPCGQEGSGAAVVARGLL